MDRKPKLDGADRLCMVMHGRMAKPEDYVGGCDSKMLHDATDRILELEERVRELERGRQRGQ